MLQQLCHVSDNRDTTQNKKTVNHMHETENQGSMSMKGPNKLTAVQNQQQKNAILKLVHQVPFDDHIR
jgi:hypothetical protein